MKTPSLTLTIAAAFALLATPARAGDRHHRNTSNTCGNNSGYYRQQNYYRGDNSGYYQQPFCQPVQYYRPAPVFFPSPFFQISFGGDNRGCR